MVHFWKKKEKHQPRGACLDGAKTTSLFTTTSLSGSTGSSMEVTLAENDIASSAESHGDTSSKDHSTVELHRFGSAFGWATPSPPEDSVTLADLSNVALQHYSAQQSWKEAHAAFLNRSRDDPGDPDAADAEEWQQAIRYAYCCHWNKSPPGGESNVSNIDTVSYPRNRVVMAPPSALPKKERACMTTVGDNQHRILYVLPAGLDLNVAVRPTGAAKNSDVLDLYTNALALYLYRTLVTLNDSEKVTIILDVRSGGPLWPNPFVFSLLSLIRHVSAVLPRYLPDLVHQVLVVPVPVVACQIFSHAVAPLLSSALRRTLLLLAGPSTLAAAPLPQASLAPYLTTEDIAYLEQLRCAAIQPSSMCSVNKSD